MQTYQESNQKEQCRQWQGEAKTQEEQNQVNMSGDVYSTNSAGQVTAFRFSNTDMTYSFAYDETGELSAINSSAGWTWAKSKSSDFRGWVIRNYFDLWQVSDEDAGSVYVNHTGIHATGRNPELMALPCVGLG